MDTIRSGQIRSVVFFKSACLPYFWGVSLQKTSGKLFETDKGMIFDEYLHILRYDNFMRVLVCVEDSEERVTETWVLCRYSKTLMPVVWTEAV